MSVTSRMQTTVCVCVRALIQGYKDIYKVTYKDTYKDMRTHVRTHANNGVCVCARARARDYSVTLPG